MITAKEYFETYLSWQHNSSNLRSAKASYESFSAMDLEVLQAEAEAGSPGAMEELGERYLFGLSELGVNADRACELFAAAEEAGNPEAMHMLAEVSRTPEYGRFDYDAYFTQLEKAAKAGSWKAMFNWACALYKGKDAYDGHGPESDRFEALKWSTQCVIMTMGLLEFYFTHTCSDNFTEYMQGVFALFVQSVCVSARQLIRGDGVQKDIEWARTMLTDAQSFYRRAFGIDCSDFTSLLSYCQ